jgi:hypothetical protein
MPVQVLHVAAAVRQLDEALEHAEAHLRVVGDAHYLRRHPAADAVEHWLMMRLMFGQSRACASAASFIQARDISSFGRTSTKVSARRQRHSAARPRPSGSRAECGFSDRARRRSA